MSLRDVGATQYTVCTSMHYSALNVSEKEDKINGSKSMCSAVVVVVFLIFFFFFFLVELAPNSIPRIHWSAAIEAKLFQ